MNRISPAGRMRSNDWPGAGGGGQAYAEQGGERMALDHAQHDAFLYVFRMFAPAADEKALALWLREHADQLELIDPQNESELLYSDLGSLLGERALMQFSRQFSPGSIAWKRLAGKLGEWGWCDADELADDTDLTDDELQRFERADAARVEKCRRDKAKAELAGLTFDDAPIAFAEKTFVLTGDFSFAEGDRDALKPLIEAKGGRVTGGISGKSDYLIVGDLGGYGRDKIKKVAEQAAKGKAIAILPENRLLRALGCSVTDLSSPPADYGDFSLLTPDAREEDAATAFKKQWSVKPIDDETCAITRYKGDARKISIPSEFNGRRVVAIGRENQGSESRPCFEGCEQVIIPEGVTHIEPYCFFGSATLKEVTLPQSLEVIEHHAFYGCAVLEKLVIPNGVKVKNKAYDNCPQLMLYSEEYPEGIDTEPEMEYDLSEALEGLLGLSNAFGQIGGSASSANALNVMGAPDAGKRIKCAAGLDALAPGGVVYWWDAGLVHVARPVERPHGYCDGIFALPEDFAREWEWYVRTADIGESDFATAAQWSAMQERNLEDDEFSAHPHKVEHAEQTLYILTKGWSENARPDADSFLSEPATFLLYRYQDRVVSSLTGRYLCYDGAGGLPPDILDMLKSVAPIKGGGASADELALEKYGDLAGEGGNIDAFKLLDLFKDHTLHFSAECDLVWDGSTHVPKGVSFNYVPQNPAWETGTIIESSITIDGVRTVLGADPEPPRNAGPLQEGALALYAHLARVEGLIIPRERVHPNLLAVLPPHDFTPAALFALVNQHSLIIVRGERGEGHDTYMVPLDVNVKNGLPDAHGLIGRFIGALRSFNGVKGPFSITFSNTRNLDSEIIDIIDDPVEGANGEGNITKQFER